MTMHPLTPATAPWDRQPGETPRRYAQFRAYLDLGRARTLQEASRALALSAAYVRTVAAEHRWRDRAAAYDRNGDQLADAAWWETRRQTAIDDARLLEKAARLVEAGIEDLDMHGIRVPDLIRLLDVVLRQRRALLGSATATATAVHVASPPAPLYEFDHLPQEQRNARLAELALSVLRRVRAISGKDDGEDEEQHIRPLRMA
ncbi:hypothetical protein [Streptomyces sp. XY533]|uniref:hypothetical protein n=1 Tax=Streptomyces sp. XY533 TaxID=1519481 RepID=UPI0006AF901E|nr:hypothetical protein [Streptomyces sp. XY533]KOU99094.1 hypothetical protein ADK92_12890 [Streptomyces sp. XY533]